MNMRRKKKNFWRFLKHNENWKSSSLGRINFLNFYMFLDASLDELSSTMKLFSFLYANRMQSNLFKSKLAMVYEKLWTEIKNRDHIMTNGREPTVWYFKNHLTLLADVFHMYTQKKKTSFVICF